VAGLAEIVLTVEHWEILFKSAREFFFAPLVIPIVILAVPIVDTVFSVLRRLVRGQSFSQADREHLHHRLMRLGHGPRRAVVILWLWTALLSAVALIPTYTNRGNALVPLALAGLALLLFTYFHPGLRRARSSPLDPPDDVINLQDHRRGRGSGWRARARS